MAISSFWKRIPFRFRLLGAFFLIIVIGFASIYIVNTHNIVRQFSKFNSDRFYERAVLAAPYFVTYYEENGNWEGLSEALRVPEIRGNGGLLRDPRRRGLLFFVLDEALIVADEAGVVIFDFDKTLLGKQMPVPVLHQGFPLEFNGQTIGTLLSGVALERFTPLAQQFFRSLNQSTLVAALIAVGISLILITLLVRHLARPLNAVTRAAERIAEGHLDQQVEVTSQDEIGQLAQAFNMMSARLKQSEELRRQMTVDIAHELRTPVSVIKGDMEALVDGIYPATRQTFESLLEETHRLSRLIDELRELTLLEAGELILERRDTDLAQLIQKLVRAFEPKAEASQITMRCQINDTLPSLLADGDRIAQVVRNLLSNAMRYTPRGGTVAVDLKQQGDALVCAVSDTGPGLSAEDAKHVFQRFWRTDHSRARHSGGSGLGLSISKRLTEAHGGELWVDSEPGKGSTFGFSLPLNDALEEDA